MKLSRQNKQQGDRSGFTLIEVVLVLAIGGLIFLLAFLAFGQATKNRRDTQRRSDAGRVISELQNAAGDANGKPLGSSPVQADLDKFLAAYLSGTGSTFESSNINYTVTLNPAAAAAPGKAASAGVADMAVYTNSKCSGSSVVTSSGNTAVVVGLEKGIACKDDQ